MNRPKKQKQYRRYKDEKSNVAHYELEKDAINIKFKDNTAYRYTNQATGSANISKMRELALAGKGLCTYIKEHVKDNYERKIR